MVIQVAVMGILLSIEPTNTPTSAVSSRESEAVLR
eukprot:SAG31_NODE_33794_length_340_cov_0.634855_1_plen_34_part_10